jgi:hypothetical protein
MFPSFQSSFPAVIAAALLLTAPTALAQRGGRNGGGNHDGGSYRSGGNFGGGYRSGQTYSAPPRAPQRRRALLLHRPSYVPPSSYYGDSYYADRYYTGRVYFYCGSFLARPYFGVGLGIPFGYGYRTNRGCGYIDGWGDFHPAPCYQFYYDGY